MGLALVAASLLTACKIIKTPSRDDSADARQASQIEELWNRDIVPYLDRKAGSLRDVEALARSDPAAAAVKYGNARAQGTGNFAFAVRLVGKVIAVDTQSRAGTLDIDVDADGKADASVQIGPVIQGSALRDSLDFTDFNDFKNQIEWAQFAKSINRHVGGRLLTLLPRDGLQGKTLEIVGAFPVSAENESPLVTPSRITIGE